MENVNQQPPTSQPSVHNSSEKPSSKYKILGIINIILGLLQIPIPVLQILFVIPQLTTLYEGLNIEQPSLAPAYISLTFIIVLGLINIFIGIKLIFRSTQNKEKYFKLGIAGILIIFLSVGISIAFTIISVITPIYRLTSELDDSPSPTTLQTPSPTPIIDNSLDPSIPTEIGASWKTYTDEKNGYSFKYPNNWGRMECPKDKLLIPPVIGPEFLVNPTTFCESDSFPTAGFNITNTKYLGPGYKISDEKTISVGTKPSQYLFISTINAPGPNNYIKVFIPLNNHYLLAQLYDINQKPVFDQILSTFRFTESYDTSNWTTYSKLSKYATFQYPKNWYISELGEGNSEGGAMITTISSYSIDECGIKDDCKRIDFQISTFNNKSESLGGFVNKMVVGEEKINEEESSTLGTTTYLRKKDILVNGITALNYIVTRKGKFTPVTSIYITLKYNGNYYSAYSSDANLLNYFIKTIKFTQ